MHFSESFFVGHSPVLDAGNVHMVHVSILRLGLLKRCKGRAGTGSKS